MAASRNAATGSTNIPPLEVPQNLSDESVGSMYRSVFGTTKFVLIDLSGTLHIENTATPNAVAALQELRQTGVQVRFVTNSTKESKNRLLSRLTKLGFQVGENEIFTSLLAARRKIQEMDLRPHFMVEEEAMEDFRDLDTHDPNSVVVGLSPTSFCYEGMNTAFNLLRGEGTLIAIHKGKYFKTSQGLCLGPGPFVAALEYATGKEAIVVGKPDAQFFMSAVDDSEIAPGDVVMIGDDVEDDVFGAMATGFRGVLVKTGKYQPGDEYRSCSKSPTLVTENFADAVRVIRCSLESSPFSRNIVQTLFDGLKDEAQKVRHQGLGG